MPDTCWLAVIAVSGALVTSAISATCQWFITKRVTDNARETAMLQVGAANRLDCERVRREAVVVEVGEMLAMTDPDISKTLDFSGIATCIGTIQLRLNLSDDLEAAINGHVNLIGVTAKNILAGTAERTDLFRLQDQLVEAVAIWVNS